VKGLVPFPSAPTTPNRQRHQAIAPTRFRLYPVSLAATQGVAFAFLSSGYSDVSIPPVPSLCPIYSGRSDTPLRVPSFLIRTSTDRSLVGSSPWLIAASHVLLRLQAPRHPPLALCSLKTKMLVLAMEFSRVVRPRRGFLGNRVPQCDEWPTTQRVVCIVRDCCSLKTE
jgi:hypothetical protein